MTSHLENGEYPQSHPFGGLTNVGFNGMAYKHHRLGVHRSVIKNNDHWRIPVIDVNSQKDPGGTIIRYQNSWHPNQERFHSHPLTIKQRRDATAAGFPNILYRRNKAIGKIRLPKNSRMVRNFWELPIIPNLLGTHCVQNIARQYQTLPTSTFVKSCLQQGILL